MTKKVLCNGSYGKVKVAVFQCLRVAAKSLHGVIISDYTQDRFPEKWTLLLEYLMLISFNLLELLEWVHPLSLQRSWPLVFTKSSKRMLCTQPQIFRISQDVDSALNYLHLLKPNPIIHWDISSHNTLLEIGNSFKAKVSDYGAANLQQQAKTEMPGNPAYVAPESRYPDDHTPAMDVLVTLSY